MTSTHYYHSLLATMASILGHQFVGLKKKKPQGLYFSKALFEGLIFGGAYIQRGLYSEGLIYGWKFAFQNRL